MLSGDAHQVLVFRTPSEKLKTECIIPNKKGKGVSVMIWGCFRGKNAPLDDGKGPITK